MFQPKEEMVTQIMCLGFSRNAAIRALFYTGNQTADHAAEWILENQGSNLDLPLEADLQGTSDSSEDEDFTPDAFKMVLVVNAELGMGVGKVAAQVAHGALGLFRRLISDETNILYEALMAWGHMGETKVVVKADSTAQLEMLAQKAQAESVGHYMVQDAGRTQIAAGSKTVLAVFGSLEQVDKVTGGLKLL